MSSKESGTQGYRYYMSLLSGLCRGPINSLVQIKVGDENAWAGSSDGSAVESINSPDLFGGDDKEGGIQGPFRVFMGSRTQILPGAYGGLPDVRASIGGLVSHFRGVTTVWFDGLVGAMNPYLKEWKFRVRRSTAGWYGGTAWYPEKAIIYLTGDVLTLTGNHTTDLPITANLDGSSTLTFNRSPVDGDQITLNGNNIVFGPSGQIPSGGSIASAAAALAYLVNSNSTFYHSIASATATTVTFALDQAAQTVHSMNGAHIIYECFTNPEWGRGLTPDSLDENSFIYAANTLCAERFGLAIVWYRKEEIDVFIQRVCDLIGAVTYTDRETGKMVLRLVRNDYNIGDLPLFTPQNGLLSIDDDDSASSDDAYNEIIGTSVDPVTNLKFQVRAQNLASFQSQQSISSLDQDYKGIPTKALLSRVVLRDLRAMGLGLKKYAITLDRRAWRVAPGSVIRISHPGRGLANAVLRVGEIDDGNMVNGQIKIKATIDVFGLPATAFTGQTKNGWVAPSKVAVPAADQRFIEVGYRDLYRRVGVNNAQGLDPTTGYVGQLALAPNTTSLEYDLTTKADGDADYSVKTRGPFTGNAYLGAAIGPLDTAITFTNPTQFGSGNVGEALLIDREQVKLTAIDTVAGTATIVRGVGDTLPAAHSKGVPLWTQDDDMIGDGATYSRGINVYAKVLTRTSTQVLTPDKATAQSIQIISRHARPYPPANLKVNGTSSYSVTPIVISNNGDVVFTWSERNRLTQADVLVGYTEATVSPEANQTYTFRIYSKSNVLLRTQTGVTGNTWTYTNAMRIADGAIGQLRFEMETSRDGLSSWQYHNVTLLNQNGWGYDWGYSWGKK